MQIKDSKTTREMSNLDRNSKWIAPGSECLQSFTKVQCAHGKIVAWLQRVDLEISAHFLFFHLALRSANLPTVSKLKN